MRALLAVLSGVIMRALLAVLSGVIMRALLTVLSGVIMRALLAVLSGVGVGVLVQTTSTRKGLTHPGSVHRAAPASCFHLKASGDVRSRHA